MGYFFEVFPYLYIDTFRGWHQYFTHTFHEIVVTYAGITLYDSVDSSDKVLCCCRA